jgi:Rad3-related DNA helicase/REP element-mobilizing transposase RayT
VSSIADILGPNGPIARRLGDRYEPRPQQIEMADAVESALVGGRHLLVEAGTGVGKSFAYLLPAIRAVARKKRVVISTHTIALQEQLIEKDIPLLRSVLDTEFSAVLVKGRGNYLCKRRLGKTRVRQDMLFEVEKQLDDLWMIEQWADHTTDGSLTDLPVLPDMRVWERVNAEQGNCMGKRCEHFEKCFWQHAKRRMNLGNILVVNHALFFSDLALRMAGVNYLPKYDHVIFDEAHTIEDVAGQHFGLRVSEAGVNYQLRSLYETRRGKGLLSVHGSAANPAIESVLRLYGVAERFFERCVRWHESNGRQNGRVRQKQIIDNDLSPAIAELHKHLKGLLQTIENDEELAELANVAEKLRVLGETVEAFVSQAMDDAVYWMDISTRGPRRVSLHAAPIDVAEGLRRALFVPLKGVVLTSATLCTAGEGGRGRSGGGARRSRDTGVPPVPPAETAAQVQKRRGAYLPHWTKESAIYAVNFRLADSLPQDVLRDWVVERDRILSAQRESSRPLTPDERTELHRLHSERVERFLDAGAGEQLMRDAVVAKVVADAIEFFAEERYRLLSYCVMPNHVHLVIKPLGGFELSDILHSLKSYTAKRIGHHLGREGTIWASEYFDHLIRDAEDLTNQVEYAHTNPQRAGLADWPWVFRDIDAVVELMGEGHGRDARVTEKCADVPESTPPSPVPPAFRYIAQRLGVDDADAVQLGSPFDYANQATLFIETNLPEPNEPRFVDAACERILHYLDLTHGGAFVLFTSYRMLSDCANRLRDPLMSLGLPLLVHGQDGPRKTLLEKFKTTPNAVLFGTASFWQGIDVQGEQLRNVIITRLPFAVPDEPLTEAKLEHITRQGGQPFMELSVPEAIIKLKQGFGRLIRSKTDRGIVVILDSRVKTRRYGRMFLDALPPCKVVEV